jgi:hypothetical protein
MHLPALPLRESQLGDYIARQVFARRQLDAQLPIITAWQTFTPSFTNLTNVGSPTITGRFIKLQGRVFFQVKIVPGTTSASVAGSTYFGLPTTAAAEGITGEGSMIDLTTKISVGVCAFDTTNSRCYVPSQTATADNLVIAGWYEG